MEEYHEPNGEPGPHFRNPPPSPPEVMTWPLLRWELDKLELTSCLPTDVYLLTFGQEDPRAEDEVARGGRQVRSPVPHLGVITR